MHRDTHENGHTTVKRMKQEIDRPVAQLILDLEERGLLDRTLPPRAFIVAVDGHCA